VDRLRLVPFEPDAAPQVAAWATSPREVRDWCGREAERVLPDDLRTWSRSPDVEAWLLVEPVCRGAAGRIDGWRAVGYGELWLDHEEHEVELAHLIVDPARRGEGLGRALAARLAARAQAGHPHLPLVVLRVQPGNEAAVRAYRAAGFRPVTPDVQVAWNRDQRIAWRWMQLA
jgi:ribosomal protein S18 acetylase RimI-like enzyme